MRVVTAAEMRRIDSLAIEQYGIPGIVLMENAGFQVYRYTKEVMGDISQKKICIFAGKGNNGGDAMVAARHFFNNGAKVKVFILGDRASMTSDAAINYTIIQNMGLDIYPVKEQRDWDKVKLSVTFADCLVDGLVGTGFDGELRSPLAAAVEIINLADKLTIAVDMPSGVNADTGQSGKIAVKAHHTVTFGLIKTGLLFYPGLMLAGTVYLADIGLPATLLSSSDICQNIITVEHVKKILPKRKPNAHKGDCGRVLIVAGSQGLTGAAALAAWGCLRCGAGLVTLGIAASLHDIMEIKLTEIMTKPLPDEDGTISSAAAEVVLELSEQNDVIAIGPGLGRSVTVKNAVRDIIACVECPLVIDADGLNSIAGDTAILHELSALAILTPHIGEMARLTGLSVEEIEKDKWQICRQAAKRWEHIVVLKGKPTVIAFPDGEIYINPTGNAGLATGGTGDVLTGIIAGLLGQGLSSHDAAVAGVYVHGAAADYIAVDGMVGRTAGDLLLAIPITICGITG